MFRIFSKTVAVTFVDDGTDTDVAKSDIPLDQLPDTFALDTQLDMAGVPYTVVAAVPQTKSEFAKTKRLTVRLRKLESIDPKSILFSLPSICGSALPECATSAPVGTVLVLHEDDWRQCEFVSVEHRSAASSEFSAIRDIHATAAAKVGWRKIHVRERIPRPLPNGILWMDVASLIGNCESLGGMAFGDPAKPILGSKAIRFSDSVVLWGVEAGNGLAALCVENIEAASVSTIDSLKRVAGRYALVFVHWCRCQAFVPDGETIEFAVGNPWDRQR
jgi:hypothetical protein